MQSLSLLCLALVATASLESVIRDDVVTCAEPASDLDGDGASDLACITRRHDDEPQRVVVVLSSAPERLALDAPVLGCPNCGGALGLSVRITTVGSIVEVEEQGGSREEWTRSLRLARFAGGFRLAGKSYSVRDRASGAEIQSGTTYSATVAESQRVLIGPDGGESVTASWLDLYVSMPSSKADDELLHPRIEKTLVDSGEYVIGDNAAWSDADDLSFTVRAQEVGPDVLISIDVKDDDVQLGPQQRVDRVEIWWDRGGDPWTADFQPKLKPNANTTRGVSLRLRPDGTLGVTQLFPRSRVPLGMLGSWKRTPSGYAVEVRADQRLFTGGSKQVEPGSGDTLVNATIIVRDVDAADRGEAALATSKLQHRGAPFEMGLLHLSSAAPGRLRREGPPWPSSRPAPR